MQMIIEIAALPNGAHRNQTSSAEIVPNGWAVVPETLEVENFPFGEITVEEIEGVATVASWSPLPMPEPEPVPETEPTDTDVINALLGVTE